METTDGLVLRMSPTPEEWQRVRVRLVVAAVVSVVLGVGVSLLELGAGVQLIAFELLPAVMGLVYASRFIRTFQNARPTAFVATDHSLRLERLDGSRTQDVDLSGISSIRIGPDGFGVPLRWFKEQRRGLVLLQFRGTRQGVAIPSQLASHPVTHRLLGRILAASRAVGPVRILGPAATVGEIESFARSVAAVPAAGGIPPITVPAGWYPDPSGTAPLRWWDGRAWTGHTRETPIGQ